MHTLRRRQPPTASSSQPPPPSPSTATAERKLTAEDHTSLSLLDILRLLAGLLLLSSALSYFLTSSSLTWNYPRPSWTRLGVVKAWLRGPISLTPAELALYNGTDPSLPIYLALNGTIYDVSASPGIYGPGGGYAFFAGRDGTRAFVTGCFETDVTPDLRGVEEMFLPLPVAGAGGERDEEREGKGKGKGEGESRAKGKVRREQERRMARKKVRESVEHWEGFFAKSKKYHKVGSVKREENWLDKLPRRELCEAARRKRPSREVKKDTSA
ncbi:MAG: hypothetical protein M1816_001988 [Peltula sp. TS41687]|nr:MAG: hypothetical protein M1816_001988 [Peltula sp. TS41687]